MITEIINEIPASERPRFYRYVENYTVYGVEPELMGLERVAWLAIRELIEMKYKRKKENG
jgi:hypothetical protein